MNQNRSRTLRTKFLRLFGLPSLWEVQSRLEEIRYSQLWMGLDRNIGSPMLYPSTLGGANASLLYLLGRILTELPVTRVIEFGAGTTTQLIGHCAQRSSITAATIEHDEYWAGFLQAKVAHPVVVCPLEEVSVWGVSTQSYRLPESMLQERFDVLVIDGPPGKPAYSRLGAVAQAVELCKPEFVIVMDDVEREGEQQTVAALRRHMDQTGRKVKVRTVHAAKSQLIMCTPAFEAALYL